ncbi:hypothetical protein [Atlantibacter sp.]|uniref:hypothetical protein n=1 Tax=Atlantibacter sp. TaxID=1903473 RepID=UPI0028A94464|nr:hypothetical protein [Atlantibacter sp.]
MKRLRCAQEFARKGISNFIARSYSKSQELPNHVLGPCVGTEADDPPPALTGCCLRALRHLFNSDAGAPIRNTPIEGSLQTVIRFIGLAKRPSPVFINIFCEKNVFTLTVCWQLIQIIPLLMNLKPLTKYLAELFDYAGGAANPRKEVLSSVSPDELSLRIM